MKSERQGGLGGEEAVVLQHELFDGLGQTDADFKADISVIRAVEAMETDTECDFVKSLLEVAEPPAGFDAGLWQQIRGAHRGFQAGCDIMAVLPCIAENTGFYDLTVDFDFAHGVVAD